jgi:hypothetical protein
VDFADPVQSQLDAYNSHDVDAFVACYGRDAVIRAADGRVLLRGHDEIRSRYEALFTQYPDVTAEVPTRIRDGLIQSVVMMRSDLKQMPAKTRPDVVRADFRNS